MPQLNNQQFPLFPSGYAMRTLKSTAYKNSAYALAEIVDNSCDANAKNIHIAIICDDGEETPKPSLIAVLDDGDGMNEQVLQRAFQYGCKGNENIDKECPHRFGRFGVGLLAATFNQCNSLKIWSWKNGINDENGALSTLGVSINIQNDHANVPEMLPLPHYFKEIFLFDQHPATGTLVVWEDLDNLSWKKADTLIKHLAFECGRIYRNRISNNELSIRISIWRGGISNLREHSSQTVGIVDPLFLKQWNDEALRDFNKSLFQPWREDGSPATHENEEPALLVHDVLNDKGELIGRYRILTSHRRMPDVVEKAGEMDPGSLPCGQLAKKLQGVSVLREGRELILDSKWLPQDQTTARWIGVSIDFDASLDKIFGVDNTKQFAHYLSSLAGIRKDEDIEEYAENKYVARVAKDINRYINKMHRAVKEERKHFRQKPNGEMPTSLINTSVEKLMDLTRGSKERYDVGHSAKSDSQEPSNNEKDLEESFEGTFIDGEHGDEPAKNTRPSVIITNKLKVDFVREPDGAAFFRVKERQGVIIIVLNQDHPLYERLNDMCLISDQNGENEEENISSEERLENAIWLIKKLLYCYARAECEASGNQKHEFERVRLNWGIVAKAIINRDND